MLSFWSRRPEASCRFRERFVGRGSYLEKSAKHETQDLKCEIEKTKLRAGVTVRVLVLWKP